MSFAGALGGGDVPFGKLSGFAARHGRTARAAMSRVRGDTCALPGIRFQGSGISRWQVAGLKSAQFA